MKPLDACIHDCLLMRVNASAEHAEGVPGGGGRVIL